MDQIEVGHRRSRIGRIGKVQALELDGLAALGRLFGQTGELDRSAIFKVFDDCGRGRHRAQTSQLGIVVIGVLVKAVALHHLKSPGRARKCFRERISMTGAAELVDLGRAGLGHILICGYRGVGCRLRTARTRGINRLAATDQNDQPEQTRGCDRTQPPYPKSEIRNPKITNEHKGTKNTKRISSLCTLCLCGDFRDWGFEFRISNLDLIHATSTGRLATISSYCPRIMVSRAPRSLSCHWASPSSGAFRSMSFQIAMACGKWPRFS